MVFQSGCTSLHSYPQCKRVILSPHPWQHLLCHPSLILAIVTDVMCSLIVLSNCISLKISIVEHFFMCLLWRESRKCKWRLPSRGGASLSVFHSLCTIHDETVLPYSYDFSELSLLCGLVQQRTVMLHGCQGNWPFPCDGSSGHGSSPSCQGDCQGSVGFGVCWAVGVVFVKDEVPLKVHAHT